MYTQDVRYQIRTYWSNLLGQAGWAGQGGAIQF